uniref:Uncharacterized protein n=1 Tax=Noctiluca scintillans TaxID=2966 RepID=A0A7S1FAM4_NOCSC|mmetsp:Transcript_4583/g.12833  ORF Transcript_4583/g.12833 Transcript_4583/m.12833 type:complete len:107 (+) Transcript_4583:46-366(+)
MSVREVTPGKMESSTVSNAMACNVFGALSDQKPKTGVGGGKQNVALLCDCVVNLQAILLRALLLARGSMNTSASLLSEETAPPTTWWQSDSKSCFSQYGPECILAA